VNSDVRKFLTGDGLGGSAVPAMRVAVLDLFFTITAFPHLGFLPTDLNDPFAHKKTASRESLPFFKILPKI
jgi:hypothetical protein